MFCPVCRAEYRPGFSHCSDCRVDLVEAIPKPDLHPSEARENERPDLASTRHFLAWFVPMGVYVLLNLVLWVRPSLLNNLYFVLFLIPYIMAGNIGAFWMIYQAVRYERRVGRYVLLAFVPFMFVWYALVRVPLRKEFQSSAPFIR